MIHSRRDYQRIQEPDELLSVAKSLRYALDKGSVGEFSEADRVIKKYEDLIALRGSPISKHEPVFLLRGNDLMAAPAVGFYAESINKVNPGSAIAKNSWNCYNAMIAWKRASGDGPNAFCKFPDQPELPGLFNDSDPDDEDDGA